MRMSRSEWIKQRDSLNKLIRNAERSIAGLEKEVEEDLRRAEEEIERRKKEEAKKKKTKNEVEKKAKDERRGREEEGRRTACTGEDVVWEEDAYRSTRDRA